MAVDKQQAKPSEAGNPKGMRVLIGTNVAVSIVLAFGVVGFLQYMGTFGGYVDMTTTSVNSLSEPTRRLLKDLSKEVRLTSLYFKADTEVPDQAKFREAVDDLTALYQASNRSKIISHWINPLQDHDKRKEMLSRLKKISRFQTQIAKYDAVLADYKERLEPEMADLLAQELGQLDEMTVGLGGGSLDPLVGQVRGALQNLQKQMRRVRENVEEYLSADVPAYSAAKAELRRLVETFHKQLGVIVQQAPKYASRTETLPAEQAAYLQGTADRYQSLMNKLSDELETIDALDRPEIEDLLSKLGPTANALLVETDDDARVVEFEAMWPALQGPAGRAGFDDRAFKGEEKLTSAILRVTHKQQTAVVFVHYGGPPLFFGGFQGMPEAPYARMKNLLEDTNFMVSEWDLKSSTEMPKLDPPPTRTVFVVMQPAPPPQNRFGQPPQEQPFSEEHRQAFLKALGNEGRALFLAGWFPGPFGPIPGRYEWGDYLEKTWGVKVDTSMLLLQFRSVAPGKYVATRGTSMMSDVDLTRHDIVAQLHSSPMALPMCAPLRREDGAEGVEVDLLVSVPARDGLWGARNIQKYIDQLPPKGEFVQRVEGDAEGPFDLVVAGTKGDAKIVVVSSSDFAKDAMALQPQLMATARGFTIGYPYPGNSALFINALHWLNDNTEFMNIGKPIQMKTIEVPGAGTVKAVKVVTVIVWPLLAVLGGLAMWFVRRK